MDLRPTANGASPRGHISYKMDTPNLTPKTGSLFLWRHWGELSHWRLELRSKLHEPRTRARGSKLVGGRSENPATPKMSHVLGYSSGSWPLECLFVRQSWLSASHEVCSVSPNYRRDGREIAPWTSWIMQKRETRRKSGPQRPVVLSMVASRGIPVPQSCVVVLEFCFYYFVVFSRFYCQWLRVFRDDRRSYLPLLGALLGGGVIAENREWHRPCSLRARGDK
ncbi:hypothetical protein CI102_202 [Trichoderma harzianum]|nr:hypothetical protein CI102_202 [Trichoderma harzianum]